jgi:hypothetical protein
MQDPGTTLPPRALPLAYFAFANVCLALALCGMILHAQDFTGFYYHPRILALTHLVTLGWITANILGSMYIVGPMSLQIWLPSGRYDVAAYCLFVPGVVGMVAHFWISSPGGMAWSAGGVNVALLLLAGRFLRGLARAKAPGFVRFHIACATINLLVAGLWGLLVGINKVFGILPTPVAANIHAHAHMAAIGWAMMLAFGVAYRLLPMFLPAEPAKGPLPWVSGILLQSGILGLFGSLLLQSRLTFLFAAAICAGTALFLALAIRTALRRKPAPPPVPPQPDFAILHAASGFLCLALAATAGMALIRLPVGQATLPLALAYGFTGLLAFLGQMVIGMRAKILSVFTWYHVFTRTRSTQNLPRPVDMPVRVFQGFTFALWTAGIPLVLAGILRGADALIRYGACSLLAGLLIAAIHEIAILKHLWTQQPG